MTEYTPDLAGLIAGDAQGEEAECYARVHDLLVRVEPLPELPERPARRAAALPRPAGERPPP